MTVTEIVSRAADRLNLTSANALARMAQSVNEGVKEIYADLRLGPIIVTANTVIGNASVTFMGVEKLFSVYVVSNPGSPLGLVSVDQLRNMVARADPPSVYAFTLFGESTVTIKLDSVPSTIYAMGADAGPNLSTLSGSQRPAFTESFHNALIYYVMAIEYDKMEKFAASDKKMAQYTERRKDLKHYIAVSAYRRIYQGAAPGRR